MVIALFLSWPAVAEVRLSVPEGAQVETLFDWSAQACENWDVPDAPARAWRGEDGRVRLVAAHHRARLLTGPSLDALTPDCRVVFEAGRNDDPGRYDDMGWLASPYTTDGRRVYALVHNEYHGHRRRDRCPAGDYMACWWNALALTVSHDGGERFESPARLVAAPPYRYRGDAGRRVGLFGPSNIVEKDGWHYVFAFAEAYGAQKRGVCVMRTRDLSDASSWRAWDGTGFTVRFADAYAEPQAEMWAEARAGDHVCAPLPADRLPFTVSGVVRHAPSGLYVAVMAGRREGRTGIWATSSPDLVTWAKPHLVWEAPLLTHRDCARSHAFYYPALLDPHSVSRNFDDTDGTLFLTLTRIALDGCAPGTDRDLVRLPVLIR